MNVEKQVVNAQVKTGIGGMVISPHAPHAHWTNGHMVLSGPQRSGPAPTWVSYSSLSEITQTTDFCHRPCGAHGSKFPFMIGWISCENSAELGVSAS